MMIWTHTRTHEQNDDSCKMSSRFNIRRGKWHDILKSVSSTREWQQYAGKVLELMVSKGINEIAVLHAEKCYGSMHRIYFRELYYIVTPMTYKQTSTNEGKKSAWNSTKRFNGSACMHCRQGNQPPAANFNLFTCWLCFGVLSYCFFLNVDLFSLDRWCGCIRTKAR